jgi:hypothetical protein
MKKFEELSEKIQNEVRKVLKAFDNCYVTFEGGEYHVSSGFGIKAEYGSDYEWIGDYTAKEVFTEQERILNYVESFHSYPSIYKGKRDYKLMNELKGKWETKFKFNTNGDIVIA